MTSQTRGGFVINSTIHDCGKTGPKGDHYLSG